MPTRYNHAYEVDFSGYAPYGAGHNAIAEYAMALDEMAGAKKAYVRWALRARVARTEGEVIVPTLAARVRRYDGGEPIDPDAEW